MSLLKLTKQDFLWLIIICKAEGFRRIVLTENLSPIKLFINDRQAMKLTIIAS